MGGVQVLIPGLVRMKVECAGRKFRCQGNQLYEIYTGRSYAVLTRNFDPVLLILGGGWNSTDKE